MNATTLMTTDQVAELLHVSRRTIWEMTRRSTIPHRRIAGTRRCLFDPAEIRRFLDGCDLEVVDLGRGGRMVRPTS